MQILDIRPGSPEWFEARAGIITASEMSTLVTPTEMVISKSEAVNKYRRLKLAEKFLGKPLSEDTSSFAMDQGKILEHEALPDVALEFDIDFDRVGFILNDNGRVGCSPDALVRGMNRGAEVKCCKPETHCKYLLEGVLPRDHAIQVHASMFVTGFDSWMFLSYCRLFPSLVLVVERDEKIMATMREATDIFIEKMDKEYIRLLELNGGRLPPRDAVEVRTMVGVEVDF